jgi:phytoene dehydrogenase-like protein
MLTAQSHITAASRARIDGSVRARSRVGEAVRHVWAGPVPNVYLCGSGSHPGPGVSTAPGQNAAQVIVKDLGLDFNSVA